MGIHIVLGTILAERNSVSIGVRFEIRALLKSGMDLKVLCPVPK